MLFALFKKERAKKLQISPIFGVPVHYIYLQQQLSDLELL